MKLHSKNPQASQPASYEYADVMRSDYGPQNGVGFKEGIARLLDKPNSRALPSNERTFRETMKHLWERGAGRNPEQVKPRGIKGMLGIVAVALVGERIANAVAEKLAAEKLQAIEQDFAEKHMPLTTLSTIMTEQTNGLPRRANLDELVQQAIQEHVTAIGNMPTIQLPIIQPGSEPPAPYQPRRLDPTEPTGRHRKDQPGAHRAPEDSDQTAELSHH